MTMKQFFLELAYMNAWANTRLRQTIKNLSFEVLESRTRNAPFGSLGNLVIHIFNAIDAWLNRIEGKNQSYIRTLGDFENWSEVLATWESADQRFIQFINELPDSETFKRIISYKSYKGIDFQTPLDEILMHVSLHGFHHRAQIALILRIEGQQPAPQLDAITYFRTKKQNSPCSTI